VKGFRALVLEAIRCFLGYEIRPVIDAQKLEVDQRMLKAVIGIVLSGGVFLIGCAFDLAHVSFTPAVCTPKSGQSVKIKENMPITGTPCWHDRTVFRGTTWELVGSISQGDVYKSRDQVLTVECSNIHEVYLVVSHGLVVGFYLPVEKGFVKLSKPVTLNAE
jgi:hypothetical protein